MLSAADTVVTLRNGVKMPMLGLGVARMAEGGQTVEAVKSALLAGYRLIDTAMIYQNEEAVGAGIRASGVPREEIFVTTKVWKTDQGYDSTLRAFELSCEKLGLDYVDLYLIHWPKSQADIARDGKLFLDTWRALEKLYEEKKVRAIGVSNFKEHHLEDVLAMCKVAPMVNQVELHPLHSQPELREYCAAKGIYVEAWSPLGAGKLLSNPTLAAIAAKYSKSVAQVILRWDVQHGVVTIPKSVTHERIVSNANIFDFELSAEDMATIDAMNTNSRFGADPDTGLLPTES